MSKVNKILISVVLIVICACDADKSKELNVSKDKFSQKGDVIGNGGEGVKIEFYNYVNKIMKSVEENPLLVLDKDNYSEIVNKMIVDVTDETLIAPGIGVVDAINIPEKTLIRINRNRWNTINNENYRMVLVLHEILGLLKINDEKYIISTQILNKNSVTFSDDPKKIDFMLIVDDSGSMQTFDKQIKSHLFKLFDDLKRDQIDFHLGLVSLADSRRLNAVNPNGALMGSPRYISSITVDSIINTINKINYSGSSFEKYFEALSNAISYKYLNSVNAGFLREKAELVVIFMVDGEDQSDIQVADLTQQILKLKTDSNMIRMKLLMADGSKGCPRDNTPSPLAKTKIQDLTLTLNGEINSVCDDYNSINFF